MVCRFGANIQRDDNMSEEEKKYYNHPTSTVEEGADIGRNTRIWHYAHVREKAVIGDGCNLGKDVYIDTDVEIGNNVKIQNGVSVYQGVKVGDNVFLGPHMTFTNDSYPRAEGNWEIVDTMVEDGVSIGAHATILSGITLGKYCMVGAGAVVTKDVPAYALVYGNPAVVRGFICSCGKKLQDSDEVYQDMSKVLFRCPECKEELKIKKEVYDRYKEEK